jgi:pimeloyl-ACP methyl ester carboxylesterase
MASPRKALDAGELGQVLSDYAPTIAVGHSFGGKTVIEATASRKDVVGIVLVEPVGCPTDTAMLQDAFVHTGRALLSIWGDNLERGVPSMIARKAACVSASREIVGLGGKARVVELPASGIAGNSHLMMAEDNSDQIADLILQWVKGLNPNSGID